MLRLPVLVSALAALTLFADACGKSKKPIVVGSKNSTEQTIIGEIVAQHLENRLKRPIQRNLGIGAGAVVYQTMVSGQLSIYPEYPAVIEAEILKEDPSPDPQMVFDRTKGELGRLAQLELMPPLGYENPPVVVVRAVDADRAKISTLSDAAESAQKWKVGISYEFQQRKDGIPALNTYKIPIAVGLRGMESGGLFNALEKGDVTMIVAEATDSRLSSPEVRVLTDDRKVFRAYQASLLVRQDSLMDEPALRAALQELSGKFTTESVRKLSAQIDQQHRTAAEVANEFLKSNGLK
jgi:glycine betaine/choline ABC-type transport system substrate-binding protein